MKKFLAALGICLVTLQIAGQPPSPGVPGSSEAWLVDLYGGLTGRTVLCAALPPVPPSFREQIPADTNRGSALIEAELAKHQIECVRDGEKFVK